jgi:DNA-binding transcriptional ArsR family regulator
LPTYFVLQMPWWRRVHGDLAGLDMRPLTALVGVRRWVPDFLTPRPEVPVPDFDAELELVRRTPPDKVAADIRIAHAGRPVPAALRLDDPARLRDRIADLLVQYWEAALAPYWARMRGVLEADMLYRARQFTRGGARLLFADLHPAVRWRACYATDLAGRLGITPGAVSQHLAVLHDAGLVTRARVGRVVLYARSDLGSRLLS